jgi:hypothetical protein
MIDGLPAVGTGINDKAIPRVSHTKYLGDLSRHYRYSASEKWICHARQRIHVELWYYQHMDRGLRTDVVERQAVVRLGNNPGRDFFGHDTTEETIRHAQPRSAWKSGELSPDNTEGDDRRRFHSEDPSGD